jgi:hypothetical protein
MQRAPKNKHHSLLADPPEIKISISKISEDVKKNNRRLFPLFPSDEKAEGKICKVR